MLPDCVIGTGTPNKGGYLRATRNGVREYQHRLAVLDSGREIPDGMVVDHLCENKQCVNPDHLDVVDQRTNVRRFSHEVETCKKGHPWTEESTKWRSNYIGNGLRECRICERERERARRIRNLR